MTDKYKITQRENLKNEADVPSEKNQNDGERAVVFDIQRNSFVDGPGIRTTVFFKGCNLACAWCHNPESRAKHTELMIYKNKCVGCGACGLVCSRSADECTACGACVAVCSAQARVLCGIEYSVDELFSVCKKDVVFYNASGGGVSFSGGECMLQIDFLERILKKCKDAGIHTAVDTAGLVPYSYFERIIPYTDLFLYDVKCMDSAEHKLYTGVTNELILENLSRLLRAGGNVWVRIPIIVGVNDTVEHMRQINEFLLKNPAPSRIELLPYHSMGGYKYEALGKSEPSFSVPDEESMKDLRAVFSQRF